MSSLVWNHVWDSIYFPSHGLCIASRQSRAPGKSQSYKVTGLMQRLTQSGGVTATYGKSMPSLLMPRMSPSEIISLRITQAMPDLNKQAEAGLSSPSVKLLKYEGIERGE